MSSENGDPVLLNSSDEDEHESQRKSKRRYSRDFLLSFSELNESQKLPEGIVEASIQGLFRDAPNSAYEQQRNVGSSSLLGSKHGGYGLLSQNRLDNSSSYSRGSHGRWDTRSTGSSDRDGDSQSDREPIMQDAGRRFGNQNRRHWQSSEHDGLLGSGAFPKPTGNAGASAPKARGDRHYPLNRITEPYQPPKSFKAMPYSRKDSTDSYNDETFGSVEFSSEDRAAEERKRRVSFELMRKEQQKTLKEKNKQVKDNHTDCIDADIIALLGNSVDGNKIGSGSKPEEPSATSSHNDSFRSSSHIQAFASRPLVPPGFASPLAEKNISLRSSNTFSPPEVLSSLVENKHSPSQEESTQEKGNTAAALAYINVEKNAPKVTSHLSVDANEKLTVPISSAEVVNQTTSFENPSSNVTHKEFNEVWADDIIIMDDSSCKKRPFEIKNSVGRDHSITILEKLFSSALSQNVVSMPDSVEHRDNEVGEQTVSPAVPESSKFASWFSEDEEKNEDLSSRELLSLLSSNEKAVSQVSTLNEKVIEHVPLSMTFESIVSPPKLPTSPAIGVMEHYSQADTKHPSSAVLTCEDLEQSILAEVKDKSPNSNDSIQGTWNSSNGKSPLDIDDRASQHLLSLLQKGTSLKDSTSSPPSDRFPVSQLNLSINLHASETVHSPEQTLTLEALFGASFINALHSAEAPISAQLGSANNADVMLQPYELPFPHGSGSNKTLYEGEMLSLNEDQKYNNIPGSLVGVYGDSYTKISKHGNIGTEGGRSVDIQLPEEDSLITVGDSLNPLNPDPFKPEEFLPEKNMEDLDNKFLNAILRDGDRLRTHVPDSSGLGRLQKGPLAMIDPNNLYHHLQNRPSSQFPHQMDQAMSAFPPLDHHSHRNQQMKFDVPDVTHHDPHHSFPRNLLPPHGFSSVGAPRYDPNPVPHQMLQHVPVARNFPHHPMQGLPRGAPLSHHPINQMHGYTPEMMHNFPLHTQQPNYGGGHGMRLPAPVVGVGGGTHPEALERLFEMEMRANSKQIHHPMGAHFPGIYGPELDMNLRYR